MKDKVPDTIILLRVILEHTLNGLLNIFQYTFSGDPSEQEQMEQRGQVSGIDGGRVRSSCMSPHAPLKV